MIGFQCHFFFPCYCSLIPIPYRTIGIGIKLIAASQLVPYVNQKKFTNLKLVLVSCYHGESEETVEQLAIENQKCSDFKLTTENHIHAGAS